MDANYKKYERFGLWDFVRDEKAKGTIRHYGFSFHSGPDLLDSLLTHTRTRSSSSSRSTTPTGRTRASSPGRTGRWPAPTACPS
ncbi:hypothetical protein EVA_12270 [gut metagenome]|uniref:Uncharacterized protein n=1 Tax=gut metagenome TaxID=749906 RepID=J9CHU9_9ZZZZ